MIVRYIGETPQLVPGQEYVVLSLMVMPHSRRPLMFMLHLPGERVTDWAWYEADEFEVLDDTLPSNWIYSARESGFFLEPAAWARPGHWDDLLNQADPADRRRAWADHRAERDLILAQAGRPPGREGSIAVRRVPPPR